MKIRKEMKKYWRKRCFIALGALSMALTVNSQSAYDALSYNTMDPIIGSARYSSMAGAFGALGGNASVTKDNPAGLGIYKQFDLTISPSLNIDNDKELGFALSNFAVVVNFKNHEKRKKGYITSSLGVSYNRLRNYSRFTSVADWNNGGYSLSDKMPDIYTPDNIFDAAEDLNLIQQSEVENPDGTHDYESAFSNGYNIDKTTRYKESGHAGQWDFSYGLNISNRVYIGAGMGVSSIQYTVKNQYDETSLNDDQDAFYLDNYFDADAIGVNFKVGAMVKVTDFFRLGVAVHTPTFYNVDESYSINFDYNNQYPDHPEISYSDYSYDLQSPFKLLFSAGFVIAQRALIGIEYDMEGYKTMRLKNNDMKIENECELIKNEFKNSHLLKIGAEFKVIDQFALRAGFAFQSSPVKDLTEGDAQEMFIYRSMSLPQQTYYISAGCGYEGKHFYGDVAYVYRNQKNSFYQMLPQVDPKWDLNLKNHNIILSLGWRF